MDLRQEHALNLQHTLTIPTAADPISTFVVAASALSHTALSGWRLQEGTFFGQRHVCIFVGAFVVGVVFMLCYVVWHSCIELVHACVFVPTLITPTSFCSKLVVMDAQALRATC